MAAGSAALAAQNLAVLGIYDKHNHLPAIQLPLDEIGCPTALFAQSGVEVASRIACADGPKNLGQRNLTSRAHRFTGLILIATSAAEDRAWILRLGSKGRCRTRNKGQRGQNGYGETTRHELQLSGRD